MTKRLEINNQKATQKKLTLPIFKMKLYIPLSLVTYANRSAEFQKTYMI